LIAEKIDKISIPFRNETLSARNSTLLKGGVDDFSSKLEKFIIRNIPNHHLTVEEMSAAMGVTPTTLYNRIHTLHGITLEDFILRSRLNYGRLLIARGVSDLGEVARQAGFNN